MKALNEIMVGPPEFGLLIGEKDATWFFEKEGSRYVKESLLNL